MSNKKAEELIDKYLEGRCTPDEIAMLESWYSKTAGTVKDLAGEPDYKRAHKLLSRSLPVKRPVIKLWPRIAAAAAILLVAGAGLFFYLTKYTTYHTDAVTYAGDVAPGKNTATLTLANGKKIVLSDAVKGELAKQAGVSITKTADGQIVYEIREQDSKAGAVQYNTLTTAKGEQYQVRLPDGTKIWLNAASVLKYPASFASLKNREVSLSGEAYFEVAKDKIHPFVVQAGGQEVTVLGTHFNINSYADEESIRTTLLEGSVKVAKAGKEVVLKPDEQAVLRGQDINVVPVIAESFTDWKEGEFYFRKEGLQSIMRKISRWYDVEVEYQQGTAQEETKFSGTVSRYEHISKVLNVMERSAGLHFKIEGKKVIVLNK